ncbi:hypothetical protein DU002_15915 [Corallincola holothuriorum]|uniref:Uncharacterized protein n=1 Tax=Corallincola holothuriorum TaxID=2282215 RepID=A0A368N3Z7_9GAMM|nr:hypothetical protein [Corallincola holothuriorum]RCU45208.1 hypothetical protein DU002_15915 [Corallincola holothuriorum]
MKAKHMLIIAFLLLASSGVIYFWIALPESITVRAIGNVPLFDPNTLAGKVGDVPLEVGVLKPGDELQVIACVDSKSDINVHARYQGKEVAVGEWKEEIILLRRHAFPWEDSAIISCRWFFQHVSINA